MSYTVRSLAIGAWLALAGPAAALAQTTAAPHEMSPDQMQQMMQPGQHPTEPGHMQEMMMHQGKMPMAGHLDMQAKATPNLPGQGAFGAIQEIVAILDADPKTDWSKVDLETLRQHLIDMNAVTLHADAAPKQVDGGLEIAVTGSGRTLVAIQRMVFTWAKTMNGHAGWTTKASDLPNGELLTVTATDPPQIQHIRGLGFIGLLASGAHHQMHHLMMAKGEFDHDHLNHNH